MKWYRKAIEQNNASAQYNLGICYANGQGVEKDYAEAYKWTNLAAAQDDEDAKKLRDLLEANMTPEQIEEGNRRAKEWRTHTILSRAGRFRRER